jgi:hypothetical protein
MKLPRFRLRTLAAGLGIALVVVGMRNAVERDGRARARRQAGHLRRAEYIRFVADWGGIDPAAFRAKADGFTRRITYHEAMSQKWRDAAYLPWLPVAPDPPPPP